MITLWQLSAGMAAVLAALVIGVIWKVAPGATERLRRLWSHRPKLPVKVQDELAETAEEPEISRRRRIGVVGGRMEEGAPDEEPIPVEIERELEHVFELYANGRIALAKYREFVNGQKAGIELRLAELGRGGGDSGASQEEADAEQASLEAALHAVDWCLSWADTLHKTPSR